MHISVVRPFFQKMEMHVISPNILTLSWPWLGPPVIGAILSYWATQLAFSCGLCCTMSVYHSLPYICTPVAISSRHFTNPAYSYSKKYIYIPPWCEGAHLSLLLSHQVGTHHAHVLLITYRSSYHTRSRLGRSLHLERLYFLWYNKNIIEMHYKSTIIPKIILH